MKRTLIVAGRRTRLDLTLAQATVLKVVDRAMTGIKAALDEAGIDIPYTHTVVLQGGQSPEAISLPPVLAVNSQLARIL